MLFLYHGVEAAGCILPPFASHQCKDHTHMQLMEAPTEWWALPSALPGDQTMMGHIGQRKIPKGTFPFWQHSSRLQETVGSWRAQSTFPRLCDNGQLILLTYLRWLLLGSHNLLYRKHVTYSRHLASTSLSIPFSFPWMHHHCLAQRSAHNSLPGQVTHLLDSSTGSSLSCRSLKNSVQWLIFRGICNVKDLLPWK